MSSPVLELLTSHIVGRMAADEQDAPFIVAAVRILRQDDDLRYEALATAFEAMAKRMTESYKAAQRLQERGLLDETASLVIADFSGDDG